VYSIYLDRIRQRTTTITKRTTTTTTTTTTTITTIKEGTNIDIAISIAISIGGDIVGLFKRILNKKRHTYIYTYPLDELLKTIV
jgi:hypothetical protein